MRGAVIVEQLRTANMQAFFVEAHPKVRPLGIALAAFRVLQIDRYWLLVKCIKHILYKIFDLR